MYNIKDRREAEIIAKAINDGKLTGEARENAVAALRKFDRLSQPSTTTL